MTTPDIARQIDALRSLAVTIARAQWWIGWQDAVRLLNSTVAILSDDQVARELQAGKHRRVFDDASPIANLKALIARTPEQEFEASIERKPDLTQPEDVRDVALFGKALERRCVATTMELAPALLAAAQVLYQQPCYFAMTREGHCWDSSEPRENWCGPCVALAPLYHDKVKA